MPIEFRCTQCDKLLRTPDDTAGKRAKCPSCGTVLPIPAAAATPPAAPAAPPAGASPFATGPAKVAPGSPFGPGQPPNPYESPTAATGAGQVPPPPGGFGPTKIDFGDIFDRTWKVFADQWAVCLGAILVTLLLTGGAFGLVMGFAALVGEAMRAEAVAVLIMIVGGVAVGIFSLWIGIGQSLFFLKVARGQEANLSDLFSGGPYLATTLGASILFALIVVAGMILCYIPGIIFALMFSQYFYLILDRNVGVMESLSLSKEITEGNKLMLFAIQLVVQLAANVVIYGTCGLGILAVAPFMGLMNAVIYLAMTGQPTARPGPPAYPQAPPPGFTPQA